MALEVVSRALKIWKPNPRQVDFIQIPFSVFEALYGGAAGGGKSELLLMLPIIYGFHEISGFRGILFRRTFPQLEESLIPRSREFYKHLGATYNDTKHLWTFPSGAVINFSYLDKDQDARDHDTAEYHYCGFDELTAFTSFMYTYLTSRVRSTLTGVPAIIRGATNPGNIGHVWVRDRFVAPARDGNVILYDSIARSKRIFIPAKLTDNPQLMEKDPTYIYRLRLLPIAEQKAKIEGDWWTFSGQVFDQYREQPYPDEPATASHVVEDFEPPSWWPRIIAADWGYAAHTWVGWAAISPDSRCFIYREYCRNREDVSVWGANIRRASQYELDSIAVKVVDPSANQKRGVKSVYEQLMEATGWSDWELGDNDRIGGKLLVHEFLRWKPRPPKYVPPTGFSQDTFQWVLRNKGSDAAQSYYDLFQPEPPETKTIPRLQITRSCAELRRTIPLCVYKERDGHQTEDVAEWNGTEEHPGDDPYDGLRYLLKAVDRFTRGVSREFAKRNELAKIHERLQQTNDQNTFYRQMARYEGNVDKNPGIWRGRKRGRHFVAGRSYVSTHNR
jgi:hypothetical protein